MTKRKRDRNIRERNNSSNASDTDSDSNISNATDDASNDPTIAVTVQPGAPIDEELLETVPDMTNNGQDDVIEEYDEDEEESIAPGGKKARYIVGFEGLWYRKKVITAAGLTTWVSCTKDTPGSVIDTILHRYLRMIGAFASVGREAEARANNSWAARAADAFAAETGQEVSNRLLAQSMFERVVLRYGRNTQYYNNLIKMKNCFLENGEVKTEANTGIRGYRHPEIHYVPPEVVVVQAFILYLRNKRGHLYGTIEGYLSGISAINGKFAGMKLARQELMPMINRWKDDDLINGRIRQATPFDVAADLPFLYDAVWRPKGWSIYFSTMLWTMFLVMAAILARVSCVTQYSPKIEDLEFPPNQSGYDDGTPKFVYISLRNWKWRKRCRGEKYMIKVERNYTNPKYCPVLWLLRYLSMRRRLNMPMTGSLFDVSSSQTYGRLKTLYKHAGEVAEKNGNLERANKLPTCSGHSIRRSFAQLAARCGHSAKIIRDVGRWLDENQVQFYVGQGNLSLQQAKDDFDGDVENFKDVVGSTWVWRSSVRPTPGGQLYRY